MFVLMFVCLQGSVSQHTPGWAGEYPSMHLGRRGMDDQGFVGVGVWGGVGVRGCGQETPGTHTHPRLPLKRAVRILLKCILVTHIVFLFLQLKNATDLDERVSIRSALRKLKGRKTC